MQQTATTPRAGLHWYVVHSKPFKEWQAAVALQDQLGLVVYLPEVRRYFRSRLQSAPLFPRYLFVQANLQEVKLSSIHAAPGVLRLVAFDEVPRPVPATVIMELRRRVDALNTQGGLLQHDLEPRQAVRFNRGPLQSLEAIFVGPMRSGERARVLVDFLGQLREAEVAMNMLEPARSGLMPEGKRWTRGKGRKIKNQS